MNAVRNSDVIICDEIGPMESNQRSCRFCKKITCCEQESNSCSTPKAYNIL